MKVKQLIRELKKMPQNLEVEVAVHDNCEWETSGYASTIFHFIKSEYDPDFQFERERAQFDDAPDERVIIRC